MHDELGTPRTRPVWVSPSIDDGTLICVQPEKIVLLPATHESVACFHVEEGLLPNFLWHLESRGIGVPEPPQPQRSPEMSYVKVNVKEGTPEKQLRQALDDFENKR